MAEDEENEDTGDGGDIGAGGGGGAAAGGDDADYVPSADKAKEKKEKTVGINALVVMEDVLDKLKLLDYEASFCKPQKQQYLTRVYFAVAAAADPTAQFAYFTLLVAWLMGVNHHSWTPGQVEDPNAIASTIVTELKKMSFVTDFPPTRLRQGWGEAVCTVLNGLCDLALQNRNFQFHKPVYPTADPDDVPDDVEDDDEEIADMIEDEIAGYEHDDDQLDAVDASIAQQSMLDKTMMESTTDPTEWKMEVERVAHLLKVHVVSDQKDWRTHLENIKSHHDAIAKSLGDTKQKLEKMVSDIAKTLEKVTTREKYLHGQFKLEGMVVEYKQVKSELLELTAKFKGSNEKVTGLTNELAGLVEELDNIKTQMEDRGSSMTDSSPLMRLKTAMKKLKGEIAQMELRLGVIEHTLLQAELKATSTASGPHEPFALQLDMSI